MSRRMLALGKCRRWSSGRARFAFFEVHAFDETVRDGINVPHLAIRQNVAPETLHELVNFDISLAPFTVDYFNRFHMRIELLPLTGPVGTDLFLPTTDHLPYALAAEFSLMRARPPSTFR